jgi:DNA-binding NarL/FixJ family response regulator
MVRPWLLLLVDDDPIFRSLATRILTDLGIELIAQAATVAAALDEAHILKPAAALVDVGLPDGDGIELAHQLAALPWHPAVVLTSADRDVAAGLELSSLHGPHVFIPKDEVPDAPWRRLLRVDAT